MDEEVINKKNVKAKATLFAVGILIGIIGTLIYLEVDLSKLLDNETISAWSTFVLVIVTGVYVYLTYSMLNEQRKTIKRDRLTKEMYLVVAPLNQRKGDINIFTYGMLPRGHPLQVVYDFYNFWDGIVQNKYSTTKHLSLAIDEYLSHKESYPSAPPTDAYNTGKKNLYAAIDKRYGDIIEELKGLE